MYVCYVQDPTDWNLTDVALFQQREQAQVWLNRTRLMRPDSKVGGFVMTLPPSVSKQDAFVWLKACYDQCRAVMWPEQEMGRMPGVGLGVIRSRSYASWYDRMKRQKEFQNDQ